MCGRTKVLDTERPLSPYLNWESYRLEELGVPKEEPFSDYEIWICPKCLEKVVVRWEVECYGDDPEHSPTAYFPEIDYDLLKRMVLRSLGIK